MHSMQIYLVVCALQDGYSGASIECTRQLVEPSHLASGEPFCPGGDEILCLLRGERPREGPVELAHPPGVHYLWAYARSFRGHVC